MTKQNKNNRIRYLFILYTMEKLEQHTIETWDIENTIALDVQEIQNEEKTLANDIIAKNDLVKSTHTLEKIRTWSREEKKFWQTVLIGDLAGVNIFKYADTQIPDWITLSENKRYITFTTEKWQKTIRASNQQETFIGDIIDSKQDKKTLENMSREEKNALKEVLEELIVSLSFESWHTMIRKLKSNTEKEYHQNRREVKSIDKTLKNLKSLLQKL